MKRRRLPLFFGVMLMPVMASVAMADSPTTQPIAQWPNYEVAVQNKWSNGFAGGCTVGPTTRSANTKILSQGVICGWPGKVSKTTWHFMGRDGTTDLYRFERRPADGASQENVKSQVKEVKYEGKEIEIFRDDVQRVLMRPTTRPSD